MESHPPEGCSSPRTESSASDSNFGYGSTFSPVDSEMGALIDDTHRQHEHRQYKTTEEVLERLGWKNHKLINIVISMAAIWGLGALPIMCSAFVVDGIKCPIANDTECLEERKRFYSINNQFNFDSDSFYSGELFLTLFFFGNMLLGTFFSYLADIIGRRIIVVGSLFGIGIIGMLCGICNSFPLLLLLRFLQGGFFTPASMVNWVLASECISIEYHGIASMLFGLWWVIGYCAVAGVAYILPDWHHFMLAVSFPSVICAVLFWFTIPESFQFLVERGDHNRVKQWIKRIEKKDEKINCNIDYLIESVRAQSESEEFEANIGFKATVKYLFSHKKYLIFLIAAIFIWIGDLLVYNAMSLVSTNLSGNAYMNYIYSGLVEIPAYLFSPLLMNHLGRKRTVIASHIFTGLSLFPLIFIPIEYKSTYLCFWLLGKLGISICFIALFVYGSEIFPTIVRNTCLGTCALFGNIGSMLSFQTQFLAKLNPILPVLFYSVISFTGGLITLVFPETISHHHHH